MSLKIIYNDQENGIYNNSSEMPLRNFDNSGLL